MKNNKVLLCLTDTSLYIYTLRLADQDKPVSVVMDGNVVCCGSLAAHTASLVGEVESLTCRLNEIW